MKKNLAVLTAAAIGVMNFSPVITARAEANSRPCYLCGGESICDEVVGHRYVQNTPDSDPEPCRHEHDLSADFLYGVDELVNHYCADCDVHWETWEHAYWVWYCTRIRHFNRIRKSGFAAMLNL